MWWRFVLRPLHFWHMCSNVLMFALSELLLSQSSAPFLCHRTSPTNKWWWSKPRDLYPHQVLVLVFQCELPFAAAFLCRVAGQVLIYSGAQCLLPVAGVRGFIFMTKARAGAVFPDLGMISSPDVDTSLSTVSLYWFTLFYPNICTKINWDVLMGLSEGWSFSSVVRQVTVDMFASDPKEGRVIVLSHLASYRYRCFSFPAWLLQETHVSVVLPGNRGTHGWDKMAHLLKPDLSRLWNREAVDTPSWEMFKDRMDGTLSNPV